MLDTIFIEQLKVDAIIGVYAEERINKQTITIDIQMQYDTRQARASDNLKYALDYHNISNDIHDFVSQSQYHLIESLAQSIADKILSNPQVKQTTIKVCKPQALDLARNVGITITRGDCLI